MTLTCVVHVSRQHKNTQYTDGTQCTQIILHTLFYPNCNLLLLPVQLTQYHTRVYTNGWHLTLTSE
jgi:hypothetical protein